jgi:hypothetical protein
VSPAQPTAWKLAGSQKNKPPSQGRRFVHSGGKEKETEKPSDFDIFKVSHVSRFANLPDWNLFRDFYNFAEARKKQTAVSGAAVCFIPGGKEWKTEKYLIFTSSILHVFR